MKRLLKLSAGVIIPAILVAVVNAQLMALSPEGRTAYAQVSIVSANVPYTQTFDTLASSGATNPWDNDLTLPGWYAAQQKGTLTEYHADSGGSGTGALYSYGSIYSNERALGSLSSDTPGTVYYGTRMVNDTGLPIVSFAITYTGEQWRVVANAATPLQRLAFAYRVGSIVTDVIAGTWTNVPTFDFVSPVTSTTSGPLNGNLPANRRTLSGTLNIDVPAGQEIMFRWVDINDSGTDYGMGIDDLTIVAFATADLAIAKSGSDLAMAGDTLTYTLDFSNTGVITATSTHISDTLPGGVSFVTYTASLPVTFTQPSANTLVWDVGDVPTGTTNSTIQVQAMITNNAVNGAILTNTVTASTAANETATANNTAKKGTQILAPALSITKSASPNTNVGYHGEVTYSITLNNSGSLAANNVLLTDTLPSAVGFARWFDQPIGAGVTAGEVAWNGSVNVGQSITFMFVVTHVGGYGDMVTNTAQYQHSSGSGSASAAFNVLSATPDLSIGKSAAPNTQVAYHSEVTYTVILTNSSVADASDTIFTDTLPISTTFARWVNQPSGAVENADVITWTSNVTAGQSIDFTFVVSQTGDYGQTITNTAEYSHASRAGRARAAFTVEPLYRATFIYHDLEDVVHAGEDVYLAGTFNHWSASAILLTADGGYTTFSTTVNLAAGTHDYRYVVKTGGDRSAWLNTNDRAYTVTGAATVDDYRDVVVDEALLSAPSSIRIPLGSNTGLITGEVFITNVTDSTGAGRGITAQLGSGVNNNPALWSWLNITYTGDNGTADRFASLFTPTISGIYSYAVRFDGNWGAGNPHAGWTYGDLNGVSPGNPFEIGRTGVLTVALPGKSVIINELDSDQSSTDNAEFIELYDGGVGHTPLIGLTVVLFNGNNDAVYAPTFDLDGYTTDANGYFVIGGVNVTPTADIVVSTSAWLQNGPDAVALFVGNATDFPVGTTVTSTHLSSLLDAIVYNTAGGTAPGLQALLNAGQPQVNENGRGSGTLHSLQRCPNGAGGGRSTNTYYPNTPTPKTGNLCPPLHDAAIAKAGPTALHPGADITYTITYSNVGLQALTGVIITDVLPGGLSYLADTSGLTLTSAAPLVWSVGALTTTQRSFSLVVHVPTTATSMLTNVASINMNEVDANLADNTATYAAPVSLYDLEVLKTVEPAEVFVEPGTSRSVTYTIRINNRSFVSDTTALTVTDVLPPGFSYVSDDSGLTPTGTGTSGDPLVWINTNPITRNTSWVFHVVASATDAITATGLYTNQLSIAGNPVDSVLDNNTAHDRGVWVWRLINPGEARALRDGTPAYVRGFVNFPPGLMHPITQTSDEFMLQDAALGASGLSVFYTGSLAKFGAFGLGDEVRVHGTLGQFNGKRQINVVTTTHVITTGLNMTLVPWPRSTGQITETTEGILTQASGAVITVTSLHLYIDDNSGVANIFRDADIPNLAFGGYAVGERVRVWGVGTQFDSAAPFDSGYEVAVRSRSDIAKYPAVLSVSPNNGATNVAVAANLTATFNLTMTNVNSATFVLQGPIGSVTGSIAYDSAINTATFDPGASLAYNTRYTATLKANLAASNGLTLTQDYVWSFTTQPAPANLTTSTKVASPTGNVKPGDFVTYTITLSNTGVTATTHVTDVLGSYYTVYNALDFTQGPTGTLAWNGLIPAGQSATLRFVARVKSLTALPVGITVLDNTASIDDGVHASFNLPTTTLPTVRVYGIYMPLIKR